MFSLFLLFLFAVLKIGTDIDVSSQEFILDMEMRLARTYEAGFQRVILLDSANESSARKRRATTDGQTTVQVCHVKCNKYLKFTQIKGCTLCCQVFRTMFPWIHNQ